MTDNPSLSAPRRARGDGALYQAPGSQTYMMRLYLPSLGRHKKRSTETTDPKKAEKMLARWKAEIHGGTWLPDADRTTFEQLAQMLAHDYAANQRRSGDRVEDAVGHLRAVFGPSRARAITTDRLLAYRVQRQQEGAANATINRELAALKRMFALGLIAGKVVRAPHIPMLEEHNARKGFFEEPDFRRWLGHLPDNIQAVAEVAYITGWRIADELLTRQWKDIDFTACWLRLEPGETKNGDGRMFPLFPSLRAVLERQRERTRAVERETGHIVPWVFHRQGRPIKTYRRAWLTACLAVGFAEVVSVKPRRVVLHKIPHDFRRTAVRNLERAGVARSAAMKMVGHKTESIYRRYAIAEEGMLREAGDKLERLHAGGGPAEGLGPSSAPVIPIRPEGRSVSP